MGMQPGLVDQLRQLPAEGGAGELEVALLINRILDPDVDIDALRSQVDNLVAACSHPGEPWTYLRELGFRGNSTDYATLDNTRLESVLRGRRGIPISLGVVLIHVARSLGHRASGINFPGHFLVRVEDQLIDPFEMQLTSEAACMSRLRGANPGTAFPEAPPQAVALRMLNNLKFHFAGIARWDLALDMVDYQLALQAGDPGLTFEQGQFWLRLGAIEAARQAFQTCLDLPDPPDDVAELAAAHLQALDTHIDTLH